MKTNVYINHVLILVIFALINGCTKYTEKSEVYEIPGINLGGLVFPDSKFTYFKKETYRDDIYLVYFKDLTFFEINKEFIVNIIHNIQDESLSRRDITHNFLDSNLSPPINYELTYDYYEIATDDPLVSADGLVNEEHSIYMLRIYNRGMPAE